MRLVKIAFSVLGLVVVVGVVAVGSLVFLMDPNKLKPVIVKEVMDQTGYQLMIEGDLAWSFYPRLGVSIEHMAMTVPNEPKPFVDLRNVSIALKFSQMIFGNNVLQGDVRIGEVKLVNIKAKNARVGLHWEKNVLTIQPMTASMYDGTVEGVAHGKDLSAVPHWDWDVQLSDIELKPLLQDINGSNGKLKVSGMGQVKFKATTQGNSKEQMLSKLNGTTEFNVKNGIVEGMDLNFLMQSADALMNKQSLTIPASINQTVFDSFTGSAMIKDGVATTDNILLVSSAMVTRGKATINLVNESIDSQMQIMPQKSARTQWEIPVLVTGSLNNPDVKLDTDEISRFIAKQDLEKIKTKLREKIQQNVSGKTGQFLQKLIGASK